MEEVEYWCKTEVDAVHFMDDWGSKTSLLINPAIWREVFKPKYKDYCDLIHSYGKYTFFHTDGFIEPIIGDLIEVGVDALNSQLFVMNIEEIAKKYKGKITFWGEIDRQKVLAFGTEKDVYEAVMRVRQAFDDGNGGVIALCEYGKYNHPENIRAVFKAWERLKKILLTIT